MNSVDPAILQRIESWLDGPFDEGTKDEVRRLLKSDPQSLTDAFFKDISFGTGGMRGLMGVGTNRMNLYTIRRATQGLAHYLKRQPLKKISVFIGYDVRNHSQAFAEEAAAALAGLGIEVHLSDGFCPTPLVSFGCRWLGCQAAIMITASHNPPAYNGYKVYWTDGGQVVAPHDAGIMQEVAKIPLGSPIDAQKSAPIHRVGEPLYAAYLDTIQKLRLDADKRARDLHIVYSPLHGTGVHLLPRALRSWGFQSVSLVDKQSAPDGNFTNAPSPNPEEDKALRLGAEQLEKTGADLFLATDPDADRVGAVVKGGVRLTGNQVACILLHYICTELQKQNKLPANGACVKTIVTTELFKKIAERFGCACIDVLTGFKYIGEKIDEWEHAAGNPHYVFGAEESCGYLFGTAVRDKDAISTACLLAEAALSAKREGKTLLDRLDAIYREYGVHKETLLNFGFSDSPAGMQQMENLMQRLRKNPPKEISSIPVVAVEDYLSDRMALPKSDVLRYWLKDQSKIVIRPSGTEPKVKIYVEVVGTDAKECDARLKRLSHSFEKEIR